MDRSQLLNDVEEALRLSLDGRQRTLWTALPCIVQSVNLGAMTIEAQPTIKAVLEDENGKTQSVNLPLLVDVPIVFPSAGGFTITFPIKVGDEVLVVFASRCIDAWWQNGGIQSAIETRMHDLSDGFAIPGPKSTPNVISGISSTGCQIRNDAGTSYVEISADGKIKLMSPSEIDITAPSVKVTGALNIIGAITATGTLGVTGAITATGEITAVTTPLHTHAHIGVATGSGTSGGPTP